MLSIQTNYSNNPNFCGLSRQLKRRPYADASDILDKVIKYPKANGIAGNLPHSWIDRLPLANRGEKIKEIYQEVGNAIATIEMGMDWKYYKRADSGLVTRPEQKTIDKARETIASVLKKHKIISDEEKVQLETIGVGTYGCAQKLTVNYEDFSLKVFASFGKILQSLTKAFDGNEQKALDHWVLNYLSDSHGSHIEANRALYLNNRHNPRFNKMFFVDLNNGGMLSKFLDKNTQKPLAAAPLECYGMVADGEELHHNSINNVVYDLGGITLRYDGYELLAKNNTARRIYNQFRHTPKDKRKNRFDSFSKQYSKRQESWIEKLKNLLYLEFGLGESPFKLHRNKRRGINPNYA